MNPYNIIFEKKLALVWINHYFLSFFNKAKMTSFFHRLSPRLPYRIALKMPLLSQLRRLLGCTLNIFLVCFKVSISGKFFNLFICFFIKFDLTLLYKNF